jgi:hypothetical protein
VAKVIEFYIPSNFRRKVKWLSPEQRGRVIELSAGSSLAASAGPSVGEGDFWNKPALEKVPS